MATTTTELSRKDVMALAGETEADPRTVTRWAKGLGVQNVTAKALEAAARKLGIALPEPSE